MELKQLTNPFNFDEELFRQLAKGKLYRLTEKQPHQETPNICYQQQAVKNFTNFSLSSQYMAFAQTNIHLFYSFSETRKIFIKQTSFGYFQPKPKEELQSTITIYKFNKKDGTSLSKTLKPIKAQVISMCFSLNGCQEFECYLFLGTKCGLLKKITFSTNINIETTQCSYYSIQKIILSKWKETIVLLCKDQIIHFFNYVTKKIIVQLSANNLPLDSPLFMKANREWSYILQANQLGTIKLWRIGQDILKAIQNQNKKFNVKASLIINSLTFQGIIWSDFIGLFIAIITKELTLKIISVSLSLMNEPIEDYQNILTFSLGNKSSQTITFVQHFKNNRTIIVLKNQTKYSWIEILYYDLQYMISKVVKVQFPQQSPSNILEFKVSEDQKFMLLRSNKSFIIGYQDRLFSQKFKRINPNQSSFQTTEIEICQF